ncbi:type II toxin-antitoxin system RelE family toxin [Merismopedia glauca]|uniref:Cytotoxic translational repressor of toxin-antitoxin stability system n=1 Tax=Merismopedia glauca CCAP 1448/3 TaxID=1296344 RepID=A0A2T1C0C0_9CYAN|nr:type II toxin-antitoxin system RelE/ParE family toxin [Merismopedia glauca]PSB01716.1 cytotoxic translational repressor of toxin-antitoxin stability system [Merismopedia glauca CCAP 1448/3]
MLYALRLTKAAEKELYDLQPKQFKQVAKKIFSLQSDATPQDCKPLKGYPGAYRVDQGEYRIMYFIVENEIQIFRVGKRNDDEVYENL